MPQSLRARLQPDFVLVLGVIALVYASLVYAPYRLLDDNWLLRGTDPPGSYPGLGFIAVLQGRPLFAVEIWLSRALAHAVGSETAITILRGLGILGLACTARLIADFLQDRGLSRPTALIVAIGAATLPPFQIYVAGGPWLTLPLVFSIFATAQLFARPCRPYAAAAVVLFALSFATYQATPFVAVPLVMLAWALHEPGDRAAIRAGLMTIGALVTALAIYYLLWRLSYQWLFAGVAEHRYSPTGLVEEPATRATLFWLIRVPQAFRLWYVGARPTALVFVPAAAIAAGIALQSAARLRDGRIGQAAWSAVSLPLMFGAAFVASDFAAQVSPTLIYSYTTLGAASLCVYLAVCWSAIIAGRMLAVRAEKGLAVICIIGLVAAQVTVLRALVIPLQAETSTFRAAVTAYAAQHGAAPRRIRIEARPYTLDAAVVQEFAWRNLQTEFYAHWFALNQLRDMGYSDDVEVTAVNPFDHKETVFPARTSMPATEPLIFDARNQ